MFCFVLGFLGLVWGWFGLGLSFVAGWLVCFVVGGFGFEVVGWVGVFVGFGFCFGWFGGWVW